MKKPKYKVGDIVELCGYKAYLNPDLGEGVITHCNSEVINTYYLVEWKRNSSKNIICFEHNIRKVGTKFKVGDVVKNYKLSGGVIKKISFDTVCIDKFENLYSKKIKRAIYHVVWPSQHVRTGQYTENTLKLDENTSSKFSIGDVVKNPRARGGIIESVDLDQFGNPKYYVHWPNGFKGYSTNLDLKFDDGQFEIGDKVMTDPTKDFLKGYKSFFGITKTYSTDTGEYLVSWFSINDKKFIGEGMIDGDFLVPFRNEVEVEDKVILKNGDVVVVLESFLTKDESLPESGTIRTFSVLHKKEKKILTREDFYLFEQ